MAYLVRIVNLRRNMSTGPTDGAADDQAVCPIPFLWRLLLGIQQRGFLAWSVFCKWGYPNRNIWVIHYWWHRKWNWMAWDLTRCLWGTCAQRAYCLV